MDSAQKIFRKRSVFTPSWIRVLILIWYTSPRAVATVLVLAFLNALVPSLQIQLFRQTAQEISVAIQGHQRTFFSGNILHLVVLLTGLIIISSWLLIGQQLTQSLFQMRLANEITIRLMEKVTTLRLQYFEDDAFYDRLYRAMRESQMRPYQMFSQLISLGAQIVTLVSVLLVLVSWNLGIGLLLFLSLLPAIWTQIVYGRRGYAIERARTPQRRSLAYVQFLLTTLQSIKEIQLFRLGKNLLRWYRLTYSNFYNIDSKLLTRQSLLLVPCTILTNIVGIGVVAYALTSSMAVAQTGLFVGYIQALVVMQTTLQALLLNVGQFYQNKLFIQTLFEYLDIRPPEALFRTAWQSSSPPQFPKCLQQGIEFRNVGFRYPGSSQWAVRNINLILRAGESIALVGASGAGKTTLAKLLLRLYEPTEGSILIDGMPLTMFDCEEVQKQISILFQDFVRYELSFYTNIVMGDKDVINDKERISHVMELSGLDTIIQDIPYGGETILGRMFRGGCDLSSRQWHKVALARALIRQTPILILDEPIGAVDTAIEATLFDRIQQLSQGITPIIITHRLSLARRADQIVIMEREGIVECGDHDTLMRAGKNYAQLFHLQSAAYTDVLPEARA